MPIGLQKIPARELTCYRAWERGVKTRATLSPTEWKKISKSSVPNMFTIDQLERIEDTHQLCLHGQTTRRVCLSSRLSKKRCGAGPHSGCATRGTIGGRTATIPSHRIIHVELTIIVYLRLFKIAHVREEMRKGLVRRESRPLAVRQPGLHQCHQTRV